MIALLQPCPPGVNPTLTLRLALLKFHREHNLPAAWVIVGHNVPLPITIIKAHGLRHETGQLCRPEHIMVGTGNLDPYRSLGPRSDALSVPAGPNHNQPKENEPQ